ncbi:MAG TPA: hypothetical protein VGF97_06170 [Rhizomicrobium sp.]
MSEDQQNECELCEEAFEQGNIVVSFRIWPGEDKLAHLDCVLQTTVADDDFEDEEEE